MGDTFLHFSFNVSHHLTIYISIRYGDKSKVMMIHCHFFEENFSTCTVENSSIIDSMCFRSIIKEKNFNGKDKDRIYYNNYYSRWQGC